MKAILQKYSMFLEVELGKACDDFLFDGARDNGELFSSYVARRQISLAEFERQMGEKLNAKVAGHILMRGAGLTQQQRETLSTRRPGTMTFQEVSELIR